MNDITRVLVVDDDVDMHRDFAKVLAGPARSGELAVVSSGADGLAACRQALSEGRPFTLAFVDVRMPGGWDGVRTIRELWQVAPDLDIVICTACADQALDLVAQQLGVSERLLVLKKPFDGIEVRQLVAASAARRRVAAAAQAGERARVRAEEELRARTGFLANVSHEIRTPMAAILGYANVLRDEELARPQQLECLDAIWRAGERLLQVLSDILEVAQLDAVPMVVESVPLVLSDAIERALAPARAAAAAKGLRFMVTGVESLPAQAHGDRGRLEQLVQQLADNAVKFTPAGGVDVRFSIQAGRQPDRARLQFEVADTGIGIAPADRQRLFLPFVQIDGSTTRAFSGTGLGLMIAMRVARAMQGDITVRSTPGAGSTFTAHCEIGVAPAPAPAPLPVLPARVLLVDDAKDNQLLVSRLLRAAGAEVVIAGDGQEALVAWHAAVAAGRPFDLLVTDLQMPRLDGYGLARALRAGGARQPILALTAHALAEDRERSLAAGCSEYLTKPVDRRRLLSACAGLVASAPSRN